MKYLFVLLLAVGVVSAYELEAQDEALANADLTIVNFMSSDIQSDIVQKLQDALKRTVEALKHKLDQGQEAGNELIVRAHKLGEKLRQMGADLGDKFAKAVEKYQGKAKDLIQKLIAFIRRPHQPTESPVARNKRSIFDRLPEVDEDAAVRRICDTVVRLALPMHRDRVREGCEKHARAVIRRLNGHRHPDQPEVQPDPEIEEELDEARRVD